MPTFKTFLSRSKPYLRWFILALTLGFILHTLRENWQQILTIRLAPDAIAKLIMALGITLLAHVWSGWVWFWIMRLLNAPVSGTWSVIVYLKTNVGKYLPGNFWHFVGRVQSLRSVGTSTGVAITGVVLEPILMALAALAIAILSLPSTPLQVVILLSVLTILHPRILNPILNRLAKTKIKESHFEGDDQIPELKAYPLRPLGGELGFVVLRGLGFILCFAAISDPTLPDLWTLLGAFSFAWLLGLVIPGAPGGLGVFEATALTLLTPTFSAAIVLGAVALYRLNSTLAEVFGAGLACLDERLNPKAKQLPPAPQRDQIAIAPKATSPDL
jgi:hypothetical protein